MKASPLCELCGCQKATDHYPSALIASAKEENAVLIACDEKILKYAQESFINCHDPR